MKSINTQECRKCNKHSYYYPEDLVTNIKCPYCGCRNLIPGWETSYLSEEEAFVAGKMIFGKTDRSMIVTKEESPKVDVVELKPIEQKSLVPTVGLKIISGILHQYHIDSVSGQGEWVKVPSE